MTNGNHKGRVIIHHDHVTVSVSFRTKNIKKIGDPLMLPLHWSCSYYFPMDRLIIHKINKTPCASLLVNSIAKNNNQLIVYPSLRLVVPNAH